MKRAAAGTKKSPCEPVGHKVPQDRPADPAVIRLFEDIQAARQFHCVDNEEREQMDFYEREAWKFLVQYLTTLELLYRNLLRSHDCLPRQSLATKANH
jgi:hypothetical protein